MANVFHLFFTVLLFTACMCIKVLIEFYDKVMKDVFLIFYSMLGEDDPQNSFYEDALSYARKSVIVGFVTVAAVRVISAVILSIIGFTPDGIAAGSLAATLMSIAAIANGGFLLAGTLVPMLQSAGAVGLGSRAQLGIGIAVLLVSWYFTEGL